MDPMSIMSLAPKALDVAGNVGGFIPAIINAFPRKIDRMNNKRIRELQDLAENGELGLTGEERQSLVGQSLESNRNAQAGADTELRRDLAATGGTTGELLQQARRDQARDTARTGLNTKRYIDEADKLKETEQRNELEQRVAVQSAHRQDQRKAIFDSTVGALKTQGAKAAQAPGADDLGMYGKPATGIEDMLAKLDPKLDPSDRTYVADLVKNTPPAQLRRMWQATINGREDDPMYNARLFDVMTNSERAALDTAIGG